MVQAVMKKLISKIFGLAIVEWVVNKEPKLNASSKYYLVSTVEDGDLLFTQAQVKLAKERAIKNSEDGRNTANYISN